eukprot:scaffold230759_cov32-Tisochrysis_lutea.AAC.1
MMPRSRQAAWTARSLHVRGVGVADGYGYDGCGADDAQQWAPDRWCRRRAGRAVVAFIADDA